MGSDAALLFTRCFALAIRVWFYSRSFMISENPVHMPRVPAASYDSHLVKGPVIARHGSRLAGPNASAVTTAWSSG